MDSTEHPSERSAPPVGALAPLFTLLDETNQPHSLAKALYTWKPVILFFMRGEW